MLAWRSMRTRIKGLCSRIKSEFHFRPCVESGSACTHAKRSSSSLNIINKDPVLSFSQRSLGSSCGLVGSYNHMPYLSLLTSPGDGRGSKSRNFYATVYLLVFESKGFQYTLKGYWTMSKSRRATKPKSNQAQQSFSTSWTTPPGSDGHFRSKSYRAGALIKEPQMSIYPDFLWWPVTQLGLQISSRP
jgi:hypothetical protein